MPIVSAKHQPAKFSGPKHGRSNSNARGYNHRWTKYRALFLQQNPLCAECQKQNILNPATVVDHITPHCGDYDLFWDPANHQCLCASCHSTKTATKDGGFGNARP